MIGGIPIQTLSTLPGKKPIVDSTQTAQVVMLYTKKSGKYVTPKQQYRSHFLANFRGILLGDRGGSGGKRVAMITQQAMSESMVMTWKLHECIISLRVRLCFEVA
jgi:hypothetical protein